MRGIDGVVVVVGLCMSVEGWRLGGCPVRRGRQRGRAVMADEQDFLMKEEGGKKTLTVEVGRAVYEFSTQVVARQADGGVVLQSGNTVLLATACAEPVRGDGAGTEGVTVRVGAADAGLCAHQSGLY